MANLDTRLAVLTFVIVIRGTLQSLSEPQFVHSGCYGNLHSSFIDANCSTTEAIAPIDVRVGSKANDIDCPAVATTEPNATEFARCCEPGASDCSGLYQPYGNDSNLYEDACVGLTQCTRIPIANMDTAYFGCDQAVYYPQTNYMYLNYYCVSQARIGRIPTVGLQNGGSGSALYLQGQSYPSPIATLSAVCSVETECGNTISVTAVDIRLQSEGSACKQMIEIIDDVTTKTITCNDNNDYTIATLYTSMKNYLTLNFSSTLDNTGYFWIGLTGGSNRTLSLNCPKQDPINLCETTTTEQSTTDESTTEQSTTDETTGSSTTTDDTTTETNHDTTISMSTSTLVENTTFMLNSTTVLIPKPEASSSTSTDIILIIAIACGVGGIVWICNAIFLLALCWKNKFNKIEDKDSEKQSILHGNNDVVSDTNMPIKTNDQSTVSENGLLPRGVTISDIEAVDKNQHGTGVYENQTNILDNSDVVPIKYPENDHVGIPNVFHNLPTYERHPLPPLDQFIGHEAIHETRDDRKTKKKKKKKKKYSQNKEVVEEENVRGQNLEDGMVLQDESTAIKMNTSVNSYTYKDNGNNVLVDRDEDVEKNVLRDENMSKEGKSLLDEEHKDKECKVMKVENNDEKVSVYEHDNMNTDRKVLESENEDRSCKVTASENIDKCVHKTNTEEDLERLDERKLLEERKVINDGEVHKRSYTNGEVMSQMEYFLEGGIQNKKKEILGGENEDKGGVDMKIEHIEKYILEEGNVIEDQEKSENNVLLDKNIDDEGKVLREEHFTEKISQDGENAYSDGAVPESEEIGKDSHLLSGGNIYIAKNILGDEFIDIDRDYLNIGMIDKGSKVLECKETQVAKDEAGGVDSHTYKKKKKKKKKKKAEDDPLDEL